MINKIYGIVQRFRRYGFFRTPLFIIWLITPLKFRGYILSIAMKFLLLLKIKHLKITVNQTEIFIQPDNRWVFYKYFILGRYDEREISSIRKHIPQNYSFIDVGANFGAWAFTLADHFAQTIAFEPDPGCFECLEKTKLYLNRNNVFLFNVALSDKNKEGTLFPSKSNKGDGRIYDPLDDDRLDSIKIQIRSFDSIVQEKGLDVEFMFVKLDAQGAEPWVLKGMQNSLSKAKDVILYTEIQGSVLESAGENVNNFFASLKDFGFKPVDFDGNFREISWNKRTLDLKNKKDFCFRLQKESENLRSVP